MTAHLRDDKFIISCAARTGSTLLQQLLRSHPDILCHGEVMQPNSVGPLSGRMHELRRSDDGIDEALYRYLLEDPAVFLYDIVFDRQDKRSVGFKFKTDEAFDARYPHINRVQDVIGADTDIKVIRLRRRDLLAQYISHQVVLRQTQQTMVLEGQERPTPKPFRAEPADVARYFLDVSFREARATKAYHGHRQIHIDYEDLVGPDVKVRGRLLRFLGVEEVALQTNTKKVLSDTRQLLENRDDVIKVLESIGYPGGMYPETPRVRAIA